MELHCNIMFNVLCTPDILSVVALCHLLLLLCKEVMIFTSGDAHVRTLYAITQHLLTCYGRDKSKCWSSISIHIYIYAITLEVVQENLNYVEQSTGKKLVCIGYQDTQILLAHIGNLPTQFPWD